MKPPGPRRPLHTSDMPATADVLVVGAGPGGATAALLLAREGLDVMLVDRAVFPRPKPCGDCLSAAATGLLDRVGLLDRLTATAPAWLDGWTLTSPGGRACTGRFQPHRGLAIERRVLDLALRDAAIEAGARPWTARVRELVRDPATGLVRGVIADAGGVARRADARLVVGADGLRSVVARKLGTVRRRPRLRKLSLTTHVRAGDGAGANASLGRMHVLPGGCVGIAPVGRDRLNVTLVVEDRHARRLAGMDPGAFMREWLDRVPEQIPPLDEEILASGPFDWPSRHPVAAGAALVGDAAGYYDPFTGQGVYQAMAAGEALAREVGPVVRSGDDAAIDAALARYARAHRGLTRPARRVQRLIEAVLSRPRLADVAIGRLDRTPAVMDRLIEVTGDLRSPAALLSPSLLARFLIPSTTERR